MSNNKKSSVEWYSNEIGKITALALNGKMTGLEWKYLQAKALEQAEAMHKKEIMDAYEQGDADAYWELKHNEPRIFKNKHDYYNQTYNHETN